ncbi:MAG: TadE/TadG family type IV pilus assembly protein [Bauldia sp.]
MVKFLAEFRLSRLFRPFNRMAGDRSGVSAVEFALILPIMLTLYIGGNEFGHALTLKRKITHVTSSIADLVTQSKTISNSDMANILDAGEEILWPYSGTGKRIVVSLIEIDEDNNATVVWSDARNDTALVVGATVTVPANVDIADTFVVQTEVHIDYTPQIGYVLIGTVDLGDLFYLRPRQSTSIGRIA